MRRVASFFVIIALSVVAFTATACNDPVGQLESDLQSGIAAIQAQPSQWEQTMSDTIAQVKSLSNDIFTQVSNLYSNALGQTQNFTFCSTQFFGEQVSTGLKSILHHLDAAKYPAPVLFPVVCNTTRGTSIQAGSTQLVTYYGYNFDVFDNQNPFKASLQYSNGQVINSNFGHIDTVSAYEVEVEFQAADFSGLNRALGPEVVLSWGNSAVNGFGGANSTLPVILPQPPAPIYGHEDFALYEHADSSALVSCHDFKQQFNIGSSPAGSPMTIDTTKGDPGHPGISQFNVQDNKQSVKTLRAYNYYIVSATQIEVDGHICGAALWGPGATFERTYRVYTVQESS